MHPIPCLANGTIEDAVEALAQRAAALHHGAPRMSKEAMDKTAFLQQLGEHWQGLDPAAKKALLGAGLGGALGLGTSLIGENENRKPWSSTLTGALAGGAIGGGLGLAGKFGPSATKPSSNAAILNLIEKTKPSSAADSLVSTATHPSTRQGLAAGAAVAGEQASRTVRPTQAYGDNVLMRGLAELRTQGDKGRFNVDRSVVDRLHGNPVERKALLEFARTGQHAGNPPVSQDVARGILGLGSESMMSEGQNMMRRGFLNRLLGRPAEYYPVKGRFSGRGALVTAVAAPAIIALLRHAGTSYMDRRAARKALEMIRSQGGQQ